MTHVRLAAAAAAALALGASAPAARAQAGEGAEPSPAVAAAAARIQNLPDWSRAAGALRAAGARAAALGGAASAVGGGRAGGAARQAAAATTLTVQEAARAQVPGGFSMSLMFRAGQRVTDAERTLTQWGLPARDLASAGAYAFVLGRHLAAGEAVNEGALAGEARAAAAALAQQAPAAVGALAPDARAAAYEATLAHANVLLALSRERTVAGGVPAAAAAGFRRIFGAGPETFGPGGAPSAASVAAGRAPAGGLEPAGAGAGAGAGAAGSAADADLAGAIADALGTGAPAGGAAPAAAPPPAAGRRPAARPAAPPAARGAPAGAGVGGPAEGTGDASQVAGVVMEFTINVIGGGSGYSPNLLLKNGYGTASVRIPPADVEAAVRASPQDWFRWQRQADEYVFTPLDGGKPERHRVKNLAVMRPAPAGLRLDGFYNSTAGNAGMGGDAVVYASRDYTFRRDGTFSTKSVGVGSTPNAVGMSQRGAAGRYTVDGWTITFQYDDGRAERHLFYLFADGTMKNWYIDGAQYIRQDGQ